MVNQLVNKTPDMSNFDAVILVGGRGTRLSPLTLTTPKPMLPTAGYPFLAHLLARIKAAGIRHVVLGTSYKANVFEEYFGNGSDIGLEIEYVVETEALGTGGAIRNVLNRLRTENVMVFNGDILSGADLKGIARTHLNEQADVTLHLVRVPDPRAYGSVPTDRNNNILAFLEKTQRPPTDQINAGCYVFKRTVISEIPEQRSVSVERETFPSLLASGAKLVGHVDSSYWRDMGRPSDFTQGSSDIVRGLAFSPLLTGRTGEAVIDPTAKIEAGVATTGGTTVGSECILSANSLIDGSILLAGATIGHGATIRNSIIGPGASIGANTSVIDCVVGQNATIGTFCELRNGLRVWPNVEIPDSGLRFSPLV